MIEFSFALLFPESVEDDVGKGDGLEIDVRGAIVMIQPDIRDNDSTLQDLV